MTMHIFTRFSRTVLIVFSVFTFTASFSVAQVVDIPDANLRSRIEEFLNKNSGDAITKADMRTLTLFSAVNADIRDLTGLEHATNLLWLELGNNAITDITPLLALPQLGGVYLDNNPLSMESVDKHIPVLLGRGVDVSYTLPSDVNSDGMVNIQDLVSVTQHFGGAGDLTADVNGDGVVSIADFTQVAGDMGETTVSEETMDTMDTADATDAVDTADTAPGQKPPRTEAFIFRKFLEHVLSEFKAVFPNFDYDVDTIFQTPGKGFSNPHRPPPYSSRLPNFRLLGIYVPDPIVNTTVPQINIFSREYKLTVAELIDLLRNLRRAKILIVSLREVYMPDKNLREVVVAKINEQAALPSSEREVPEELFIQVGGPMKPSDTIYEPEMRLIGTLKAEAAGIEDLTGLEYAINLKYLYLGNPYNRTWDLISVPPEGNEEWKYITTKPETPNMISDLTPLSNLQKLESLDLGYNAISNLHPLSFLKNLKWLNLEENKITDISPLNNLTNLTFLSLRNGYYSPEWAGNNAIWDLSPLGNLSKLEVLHVDHNPIMGRIDIVRSLPKLKSLSVGCCGVSNLRLFLEHPQLGQAGGSVYLVHSPLTEEDVPDLKALSARGVWVDDGIFWTINWKDGRSSVESIPAGRVVVGMVSKTFNTNKVGWCSVSHRESFRAAPTLQPQLRTEPDILSSVWHELSQVPEETSLLPNYPNPFNPETWIPYQLAIPAEVTVTIHAADGRLVRTLSLGYQTAGVYKSKGRAAYWDGRNALGEPVASGVYFYTLMAGDFTATKKVVDS